MTMKVKYQGLSDFRRISAEDFSTLGIKLGVNEKNGLEFANGEVKELTNDVANALLELPTFTGEFAETSEEVEEPEDPNENEGESEGEEEDPEDPELPL